MKARIVEIKRFAVHDGPGIRTTVFFKGCPLKCVWCHNPESIRPHPQLAFYESKCLQCGLCKAVCPSPDDCGLCGECAQLCPAGARILYGKAVTVEQLLPELLEDREFYANSGGGVTLSGGECLTHAPFCQELLQQLKQQGIHTAVDTCGFVPQSALDLVIPHTDIFLYDMKAVDEEVHRRCTGQPNRLILDNLRYLDSRGCAIEVRIPFVPGYNNGEVSAMAEVLSELKHLSGVRVLAYHNYAGSKYEALHMANTLPSRLPTPEELENARDLLRAKGIAVLD